MDRQNVTLGIFSLEATLENVTYKCGIVVCLAEHCSIVWHDSIMILSFKTLIIQKLSTFFIATGLAILPEL